jgi:hypothetical protein
MTTNPDNNNNNNNNILKEENEQQLLLLNLANANAGNNPDDDDDDQKKIHPPPHHSFEKVTIEIDCETLLKEMMRKAEGIVGMVVDLTNDAWAKTQAAKRQQQQQQHLLHADDNTTLSSSPSSPVPAATSTSTTGTDRTKHPDQHSSYHRHGVASKLGAKTVSEVSLDLPPADDRKPPPASSICSNKNFHLQNDDHSDHDDDDDDDDENTNPSISAEKARHIIDFVFGEKDGDGFQDETNDTQELPPPSKKPRIETM